MLTLKKVNMPEPKSEYIIRMNCFKGLNLSCDQGLVSIEESPNAKNVDCSQGVLARSKGFGEVLFEYNGEEKTVASLPTSVVRFFELRQSGKQKTGYNNFYFSGADGKLYRFIYNDADDCFEANSVDTEIEPSGKYTYFTQYKYQSRDRALLGGDETEPYLYEVADGVYSRLTGGNLPKMSRTAVHYSRMFGVGDKAHPQRIWFSALGAHCNFEITQEEGGYIDITDNIGDTIDVISFFDTLYVFCRYGIVALNTLSEVIDYSLENVFYSDSEIIPGSVCVCDGNIIFATRYGIYAFNGISVKCVSTKIRNFFLKNELATDEVCSNWYSGCYFVSYFLGTSKKRGILVYDFALDSWQIIENVFVSALAVFQDNGKEKLVCAFDGGNRIGLWGETKNDSAIASVWESSQNDFGLPATKKRFKELHFIACGSGKIEITLFCDGKSQTKEIELSLHRKAFGVKFDIEGVCVSFKIVNKDCCYFNILPITFIYTAEREYVK